MRPPFRSLAVLFSMVLIPAGVSLPARSTIACNNSIAAVENEMVAVLSLADDNLDDGKPGAAVQLTLQHFPDLKTIKEGDRIALRAQRILATAIVRMDGLLAVRGFEASTSDERRANLEWSVATLRSIDQRQKNSPSVMAELAEALSALPEHQQEAFNILEDLARRDVIPNPYAYRALARLRGLVRDEAGKRAALDGATRLHRSSPPSDPAAWGFEGSLPAQEQPLTGAPRSYGVAFRRARRP